MFNTAPASDFLDELSKADLNKEKLKELYFQSIIETSEKDTAAAREIIAATKDAKAAAERAEERAAQATALTERALQEEANLAQCLIELLRTRGDLSARGVFDYVEEYWRNNHPDCANMSRLDLWRNILRHKPGLRDCLAQSSVFGTNRLAEGVVEMYKTLCEHIHSNKSPAEYITMSDKLCISEAHLSKRKCRALLCVCKAFGFPAELKLKRDGDSE